MKTLPLAEGKAKPSRLSRIVYRVTPGRVIELVAIGPRPTIYEETLALLRRSISTP